MYFKKRKAKKTLEMMSWKSLLATHIHRNLFIVQNMCGFKNNDWIIKELIVSR
jgi:hypothetical protein